MKSGVSTWLTTLNTIEKVEECVKQNFRKETQNDSKRFHQPLLTVVDAIVDRESF
jgi:hypothetical protein